jgi:YfiH family protein
MSSLAEEFIGGEIPRYELPLWREAWGLVAGVTGAGVDLGLWTARPVAEVMGRWRCFREVHRAFPAVVLAHQVHGTTVLVHEDPAGWQIHDGADGHLTAVRGALLTVTVADCVPVYLAAPGEGAVALLHAGWRGTAGGILARGAELLMARARCTPAELVAHLGVAICGACYEVGAEVARACAGLADGPGPWHVDLRECLAAQARALGIERVTLSPWCTAHDAGFHSHRASRGTAGRMVAYLGIPA